MPPFSYSVAYESVSKTIAHEHKWLSEWHTGMGCECLRLACYSGLVSIPSRGGFDSPVARFYLGRVPHAHVRGVGRAAGGEHKLHCLKHASVTHLLDAGADLAFVKDWLDLANLQNTTIIYGSLRNVERPGTHNLCESSGSAMCALYDIE